MKNLNQITSFIEVAKEGSFTKASAKLGLPKSTLSHHIAELEKRLGVSLIQRTTRSTKLTSAGENYFRKSSLLLDQLQSLEEDTRQQQVEVQGLIKMTAPMDIGNYILAPIIARFMEIYPKVQIQCDMSDRMVDLVGEGFDLAIRAGFLKDSTMKAKLLGYDEFGLYVSASYLKKNPIRKIEDLNAQECILFSSSLGEVTWNLQSQEGSKKKIRPQGHMTLNNLKFSLRLAAEGRGIAALPMFLADSENRVSNSLVRVLPNWSFGRHPISIVTPPVNFKSQRVKVFSDFITTELRQALAECSSN